MVKTPTLLVAAFVVLLAPRLANAEPPPSPSPEEPASAPEAAPALHHAPLMTARASEDVPVAAALERPDRIRRALLVWTGGGGSGEVEFQRSSGIEYPYVAVIPGTSVAGRLAYAIELETVDGARVPVFATRAEPHPVTILDSPGDAREAALLARLGGRRSVVAGSGEFVHFGSVDADVLVPSPAGGAALERRSVRDQYYRVEGSYTYRLLGTISEFGIRAGVVRGRSLVPGEVDPSKYEVGLNYRAPRARLRLEDWLHVDGELLTSVTEVGFSVGGGGAVLLGDPYGSKLVLGGESIQVFGSRGYSRLDLVANRTLTVSPTVEVTTMPHADRAGVRLLTDVGFELGRGLRLDLRGGYQARTFQRGGPSLGGALSYAF